MMQKLLPVCAIAVGIYAALGIWFPRLRGHWKGTRIQSGALSCAGFAIFFLTIGVTFLTAESVPERHRIWFVFPGIIGWILGAAGYTLDVRKHARSSSAVLVTPAQLQAGVRDEQRGWFFVAFGNFFLLMVLWIFVFSK